MPYSDVVLGARAYSWWTQDLKPEAWRREEMGHANFQYVPQAVGVEDNDTERRFQTEATLYGGWATKEWLPKYQYQTAAELGLHGPRLKSYQLVCDDGVQDPDFHLTSQVFGNQQLEPDRYRASGYFLQKKLLMGGKIKHNVALLGHEPIDWRWPEAARVALEFGRHQWFVELRTQTEGEEGAVTCFTDMVCPYCGCAVGRGPDQPSGEMPRGYCFQCMRRWEAYHAMDGRG